MIFWQTNRAGSLSSLTTGMTELRVVLHGSVPELVPNLARASNSKQRWPPRSMSGTHFQRSRSRTDTYVLTTYVLIYTPPARPFDPPLQHNKFVWYNAG